MVDEQSEFCALATVEAFLECCYLRLKDGERWEGIERSPVTGAVTGVVHEGVGSVLCRPFLEG